MKQRAEATVRPRGRPSKFGRPGRVVAVTLPNDAIERLRRVHRDLGWAILTLLDRETPAPAPSKRLARTPASEPEPDVELVSVADRRSLIVINREHIKHLPGVNLIPLRGNQAFLALDIDRGMSDLELAVSDRLDDTAVDEAEARVLADLRTHLTAWRRDHDLKFHRRAIIVVERRLKTHGPHNGNGKPRTPSVSKRKLSQ